MDMLTDDLLADVFGRLPPRSLAASRCVCKNWHATIDTRRLLRADLLPLLLHGFYFFSQELEFDRVMHFFSRRHTSIGPLEFMLVDPDSYDNGDGFMDHCNGLLLIFDMVVNPATRQWETLPPIPPPCVGKMHWYHHKFRYIAYDPMVSPHSYEVVCFSSTPNIREVKDPEAEWPPATFMTYVFSSVKGRWELRSFLREGDAAGTIADMQIEWISWMHRAVYLKGILYVHCINNSIARIALSSNKYQMIPSPDEKKVVNNGFDSSVHLQKSEKGVYYTVLCQDNGWPRCRIWILHEEELCGGGRRTGWILRLNISLQAMVQKFPYVERADAHITPWIVHKHDAAKEDRVEEGEFEWDFEHGGIVLPEINDNVPPYRTEEAYFLGFHPYKEIAFFSVSRSRVVSYHLNSSRVQELGFFRATEVRMSFPYTPCWLGELPQKS